MVQLLRKCVERASLVRAERSLRRSRLLPTWALDEDQISRATIRWPREYQWAPSSGLLEPIREGLAHWARVERHAIAQPYKGVCVFEMELEGLRHRIAVDYSDYAERIERECLAEVTLYFKMQCLEVGYGSRKILPGGYVMGDRRLVSSLPGIREAAKSNEPRFGVYGRFGQEFARELRSNVVEKLRCDASLGYEGGMVKVPYRQSLKDASQARICIDLPGNGDFCFRLFDYLAVGAFVIAYPHRTTLPIPLLNGHHLVYMRKDLSDLLPLCHYYLDHSDERRMIQENAAKYFDACCDYRQLGSWYLQQCLNTITGVERTTVEAPVEVPGRRELVA
jgi:glycosyl transferase family 1